MPTFLHSNPTLSNGAKIPLSGAVIAGDFVYLSGQLAMDENWNFMGGDIEQQTLRVLGNIKSLLAQCDTDLSSVIKATVWLSNAEHFPAFNKAYASVFSNQPPTRSTVVCELLVPGALVEIEVVAFRGNA